MIWIMRFALVVLVAIAVLLIVVIQPVFFVEPGESEGVVSARRLEEHVRKLAIDFLPRDAAHPDQLDRVAGYIEDHFRSMGGRVSIQPYEVDGCSYRNVTVRFGRETSDRIVVGAHYDAAGEWPGADDNASGVAGLLELGRILGGSPPEMTVELVAYTLEEPPHFRSDRMGSAVHARQLRSRGVDVRLMICLEMIGYFSDETESQILPLSLLAPFYPSAGNFIAVIGNMGGGGDVRRVKRTMMRATALPVHSFCAPPKLVYGIDLSDHLNYWREGFPAVMITDTAFFRNRAYHTKDDTPARLDYERMAFVVEALAVVVRELALEERS